MGQLHSLLLLQALKSLLSKEQSQASRRKKIHLSQALGQDLYIQEVAITSPNTWLKPMTKDQAKVQELIILQLDQQGRCTRPKK